MGPRFAFFALCFAACLPADDVDTNDASFARVIDEGTPDATGVLELLNHEGATLTFLDDEVGLDKRAAKNLVHHRDGADRIYGTPDDNPFDSIAEVDGVYYIGKAALTLLRDYARANGWVPGDDDLLGTYDSVSFTVAEANTTVDWVNVAPEETLDIDLALDRRAVDSILAARPLSTVEQLSGLYYVGKTAMTKLKDQALADAEADAACNLVVTTRTEPAVDEFNRLMELTTMSDTPWSDVKALQMSGCKNWLDDADAQIELKRQLWNSVFHIMWDDRDLTDRYRIHDPFAAGAGAIDGEFAEALVVIDERTADGQWDASDPVASDYYARRTSIVDDVMSPIDAETDLESVHFYFDMEECWQSADAVIDLSDGRIWIYHQNQHC